MNKLTRLVFISIVLKSKLLIEEQYSLIEKIVNSRFDDQAELLLLDSLINPNSINSSVIYDSNYLQKGF